MLPSVEQIATALGPIVKKGLPVYPEFADETLLGLPGVLNRSHDPDDRLSRVKALDELLREHLAQYPDDVRLEVAGILLGVKTGSRRQPIGERRKAAARCLGVGTEHVRTGIQPKVIKTLAWELHRDSQENALVPQRVAQTRGGGQAGAPFLLVQLPDEDSTQGVSFSARAGRAGKHLYRYVQHTILSIEAYEACSRCEVAANREDHEGLRIVPARRTVYSDESLWMFVHCMEYLREMKSDSAAREYLREHVSIQWWDLGFFPFDHVYGARLHQTLVEDESDSPRTFVELLSKDAEGAAIAEEWLAILTGQWQDRSRHSEADDLPLSMDRRGLLDDLLELCATLQHLFPEETLSTAEVSSQFRQAIVGLTTWGRADEGVMPITEQHRRGLELVKDALDNPPERYALRSREEKVAWPSSSR